MHYSIGISQPRGARRDKEGRKRRMKTGIIFDMDGTLWDSASQVAAAWSQITVPKLGKQVTAQDMYRTMGMPMDELEIGRAHV